MFVDNLKRIRKLNKLTQQNVADVLGVDRTTYTAYERGTATPTPYTLLKIAQIFNVTVDSFFSDGEPQIAPGRIMLPTTATVGSGSGKEKDTDKNDTVSVLNDSEKMLLIYYRVLHEDQKKEALELMKELSKQSKKL